MRAYMPHNKGYRRKTRQLLSSEGKRGLSYLLNEYKVGDRAVIKIDPAQHRGMPHRRFHGKVGTIKQIGKRSVSLNVMIGNKEKNIYTRYEHITPFKG